MATGIVKKLQDLVESVYLVKDPYITEVMLASVIAHRLPNDPVWLIIVGPSGSGKSEFVNLIGTVEKVFPLSTLTSHTFISGQKNGGKETSLLTKIQSGIITFKDFTSLLSEHQDDRAVIMGQLREIYDGKYSKSFGTGETINWQGKITVVAGSTHVIHTMKQSYVAMGERFIMYEMIQPERKEAARRTMENQQEGNMGEKRTMLAEAMRVLIDTELTIPSDLPKISTELQDELLDLAELATRARSDVERNWRSPQQELTGVNPPEVPTRVAGQLQSIAKALMVITYNETGTAELLDRHRQILYKMALDSITKARRKVMVELSRYDVIETSGLAVKIGLPTTSVRRTLEDLVALDIAEREKGQTTGKGDKWNISPKYMQILRKFENIEVEGGTLTEGMILQKEVAEEKAKVEEYASLLGGVVVHEDNDGNPIDFFNPLEQDL